jgi:hypothetical protein
MGYRLLGKKIWPKNIIHNNNKRDGPQHRKKIIFVSRMMVNKGGVHGIRAYNERRTVKSCFQVFFVAEVVVVSSNYEDGKKSNESEFIWLALNLNISGF